MVVVQSPPDTYALSSWINTSFPNMMARRFRSLIDESLMDSELQKLHSACKDWGFFPLVNHGVSSTLVEKMRTQVEEFFNLPMEEKKKLWQYPGELKVSVNHSWCPMSRSLIGVTCSSFSLTLSTSESLTYSLTFHFISETHWRATAELAHELMCIQRSAGIDFPYCAGDIIWHSC
ncbi:Protein SRG1 [Linum perenne]